MKLQKRLLPVLTGILIFGVFVAFYFAKVASTIYGGGDSGDLITASYFLGVPHPPGYPLYTLIGAFFAKLPIELSIAGRVNLSSVIFEAAAASIVFGIIYLLTKRILISAFGAATLAFSYGFWFYGEFAEVFPLNNFLASLILLALFLWYKTGKKLFLFSLFFLLGLALTNHQTIILLFPAVFLFLIFGKISLFSIFANKGNLNFKTLILACALFLIPASLYLYPAISAKFISPPIAWDDPVNLKNLARLITRADYGTFQSSSVAFIEQPQGRIGQIALYFQFLRADFTVLGLILLFLGFIFLFVRNKRLFTFLFLGFLLTGPLFLAYANFPIGSPFEYGVIERFTLMSFIICVIVFSLAVFNLSEIVAGFFQKRGLLKVQFRKYLILGIETIFLALPLTLFLLNNQRIDLSKNFSTVTFVKDVFASVPEDSILLARGDVVVLNAQYLHLVEKLRPDLKIVFSGILPLDWYYYKYLAKLYPDLAIPQAGISTRISEFVKANSEKFPIFQYGTPPNLPDYISIPHGLVWKFVPKEAEPDPKTVKEINDQIWPNFTEFAKKQGYLDLISEFTQTQYSEKRFDLGQYFFAKAQFFEAANQFATALSTNPQNYGARIFLGKAQAANKKCDQALANFNYLTAQNPNDYLILEETANLYKNCFANLAKSQEFANLAKKVKIAALDLPSLEEF